MKERKKKRENTMKMDRKIIRTKNERTNKYRKINKIKKQKVCKKESTLCC